MPRRWRLRASRKLRWWREAKEEALDPKKKEAARSKCDRWTWRGEGGAHIVLSYVGMDEKLRGFVLRLRKPDAPRKATKEMQRLGNVEQLLGERYATKRVQVLLHPKDADALLNRHRKRSASHAKPVSIRSRMDRSTMVVGELMEDLAHPDELPFLCVEIKPKCGVPLKDPRLPRHMCAFALKNGHKTRYRPADLFSMVEGRMKQAVLALLQSPGNNWRAFVDGQLKESWELPSALRSVVPCERKEATSWLAQVVVDCLKKENLLLKLLELQQRDGGGVHEVNRICQAARGRWRRVVSRDHKMKVAEYLLARAASDCSLMLSIKPKVCSRPHTHMGCTSCPWTGAMLQYRLKVIDFEVKHWRKVETHLSNHEALVQRHRLAARGN